jgi:hypothetical protein
MKKLDKKRLAKLVFWLAHIVAIGAIALAIIQVVHSSSFEKAMFSGNKECLSHYTGEDAIRGLVDCSGFMKAINDYDSQMEALMGFGIGLLAAYWIIRWLYKYLFAEDKIA